MTFDVHDATVLWDGQPRHIKADATGSTPLVGMLLLDRHNLNIEVERGGLVAIEARAYPAEKRAFWRPAETQGELRCRERLSFGAVLGCLLLDAERCGWRKSRAIAGVKAPRPDGDFRMTKRQNGMVNFDD